LTPRQDAIAKAVDSALDGGILQAIRAYAATPVGQAEIIAWEASPEGQASIARHAQCGHVPYGNTPCK